MGSLCLFDFQPRRLSADALNLLACLAEMATRLLEEHKVIRLVCVVRFHASSLKERRAEKDRLIQI
jgi:hypothetical protein